MDKLDKFRITEVSEIIAVIRVLFIFLIFYSIYSYIPLSFDDMILNTLIVMMFIIITSIVIFKSWGYFVKTSVQILTIRSKDVFFLICQILLLTLIIYLTGAFQSKFKNLYFVAIIINSIRFGSKMGILSSVLGAAGIIFNDIIFQLHISENVYLEADLIIIITFFITGWMLGTFMEHEIEYRKQLSQKVITDVVTGLYNHRYFQERLNTEIQSAKKAGYKLALIIIDLDYFKYYNDTFGHQQGDLLLKEVGQIIKECIKDMGIVCRYGGDEFAVILPDTRVDQITSVAEKIRRAIEGKRFFGEEKQPGSEVTASVGIAIYPENASDKDELIKKSDDAMYKAKFMSKNRVELYFSVLDDIKVLLNESEQHLLNSIRTLITIINAKDKYTYGHSERVVLYSTMIGKSMGMTEDELRKLRYGAYLHDIGKIEISRDILNKETALTEEEWQILKGHPVWGADIIKPIRALNDSVAAIMYHHERFDGWGYPQGLKGYDIPLCARILAVADSFDAMMTKRPYKKAKTLEEAVEELERCKGSQFDPEIVHKFIEILLSEGEKLVV